MESETIINPFENDDKYQKYLDELSSLRKEGEDKIIALKEEIRDVKANKTLEKDVKDKIIAKDKKLIKEAKKVKEANREQVKSIVKEASKAANEEGKAYYLKESALAKVDRAKEKEAYQKKIAEIKEKQALVLEKLKAENAQRIRNTAYDKNAINEAKKENAIATKANRVSYHSALEEAKNEYEGKIQEIKNRQYDAYLEKDGFLLKARNGHRSIVGTLENKLRSYAYEFKLSTWLLRNALNLIVVAFFLFSVFYGLGIGKNLFTSKNIMSILGQSSVKIFYSLGVAGLILLGGTDLSVGRMTGLGAGFFNMILAREVYKSAFGFTIDVVSWPIVPKVILAFLVPIILCTIFSSIAGFFTAKFKMHPFITTLSTQLLIYGLFMIGYGSYPAFNADLSIAKKLKGNNYLNIIIAAVIVIAIVWFIWNKTKFGKNMYAVGGNSEAASVSGVSVFWTTLIVFAMAGVLYGLGGAATALQGAGANPNTGYGTELDAIAACVIGGVSFSGGIGKISGVVLGTIIFQGMTYCLTFLGFDVNIQYLFKGIIIMAAVCLDSMKYLKKK
ncbi:MAG TPA: galactoside ABC transporter permease [Firmicutes bacterium]|nr:galactoside ABC transporter permease [Bacillota bacterium]